VKNVLLVTFYFPPYSHPGVQRPLKFARYLPEFGYHPVVLTCGNMPWDCHDHQTHAAEVEDKLEVRPVDAPRFGALGEPLLGPRFLDKLVLKAESVFFEDRLDWALGAREAALRLVRDRDIHLVWTTGPPHSAHFLGRHLGRKASLPWVADFRDPMAPEPSPEAPAWARLGREAKRRSLLALYERMCVNRADAVVVVTDRMAEDLRRRHPRAASKVTAITNGFDDADFVGVEPRPGDPRKCTLVHTGRFWDGQTPADFLAGLRLALRRAPELKNELEVVFVGPEDTPATAALAAPDLRDVVRRPGAVGHREAIARQLGADANLLIVSGRGARGGHILTGKVFEYLRAGRPVLAVVPRGEAHAFIEKNGLGRTVHPADHSGVAEALLGLHAEWKRGGLNAVSPPAELLARYTRRRLTGALAALFDRCPGPRGHREG